VSETITITTANWYAWKSICLLENIRWNMKSDVDFARDFLKCNNITDLDVRTWRFIDKNIHTVKNQFIYVDGKEVAK